MRLRPRPLTLSAALLLSVGTTSVAIDSADAAASCAGTPATIVGTAGDDELTGTDGPDVIAGLGGDDTIRALGGDDILCGDDGSDQLIAGPGDDALHGGLSGRYYFDDDPDDPYFLGDRLVPGPGDDQVDAGDDPRIEGHWERQLDWVDLSGAAAAVTVDLGAGTAEGEGHDELLSGLRAVTGSAYDDVLVGGALNDELVGGPGADTLDGAGGNDLLSDGLRGDGGADAGDDVLRGGDGNDSLSSGAGADTLDGGPGNDGLTDSDRDADVLHGGAGDDELRSGIFYPDHTGGFDALYGDAGDDDLQTFLAPGAGQVVDGGVGTNRITLQTRFFRNGTEQHPAGTTDLRDGTTTIDGPTPTTAVVLDASVLVVPARWTVWGTDGPEEISAPVRVGGPLTAHGRGGDDRLLGTSYVDLLDGGDGMDYADSEEGDDTCVDIERTNIVGNTCDEAGVVGTADLVSVGVDRELGEGYAPRLSGDGRFVVFQTDAALVPADTNTVTDIYVRDRDGGRTELASVTSNGTRLTRDSTAPDISADGRFVVFSSLDPVGTGLAPGRSRIFLHDRRSGRTTLMSVTNRGRPADDGSYDPTISDDGSRVAFRSYAANLGGDHLGVYVRDRSQGRTVMVTRRANGKPAKHVESFAPEISGNGRFVMFTAFDEQITDTGVTGLFVRDLTKKRTQWVDNPWRNDDVASISANGRYVAFSRIDPDCPGEETDCSVVMVRDLHQPFQLRTVSVTADGRRPDGSSYFPEISAGGRYVLFTSWASDLVEGDDNGTADVFVRDLRTGITSLVSTAADGGPANGRSGAPGGEFGHVPAVAFAGDGGWLAFESEASNLVAGDDNGLNDLFVRSWATTTRK